MTPESSAQDDREKTYSRQHPLDVVTSSNTAEHSNSADDAAKHYHKDGAVLRSRRQVEAGLARVLRQLREVVEYVDERLGSHDRDDSERQHKQTGRLHHSMHAVSAVRARTADTAPVDKLLTTSVQRACMQQVYDVSQLTAMSRGRLVFCALFGRRDAELVILCHVAILYASCSHVSVNKQYEVPIHVVG